MLPLGLSRVAAVGAALRLIALTLTFGPVAQAAFVHVEPTDRPDEFAAILRMDEAATVRTVDVGILVEGGRIESVSGPEVGSFAGSLFGNAHTIQNDATVAFLSAANLRPGFRLEATDELLIGTFVVSGESPRFRLDPNTLYEINPGAIQRPPPLIPGQEPGTLWP